jgi:hypothetical protein
MKTWYGNRPVLKDSHIDDLETAAAINEFEHGMPRSKAEAAAYDEYIKDHHRKACAHHLRGMRASQASGDIDASRLHGDAYHHHMAALGYDDTEEVPEDIKALVEDEGRPKHYKFKGHPADQLLLDSDK